MVTAAFLVVAGMAVLVVAAEFLVRSSVRIATGLGVPALVVGLTVVAFGTSAPEMAMSVGAALTGDGGDVATGNVVGSGISNVLLILGITALTGALVVHHRLIRLEVPLLILVTGGVWWLASDGVISAIEGLLLLAALGAYTTIAYRVGRKEGALLVSDRLLEAERAKARQHMWRHVGIVIVSLGGLILGSELTVNGATELAVMLGIDDLVIGLTVVAVGTSLPELVTCVVAVRRSQADIAVGNILGSNLFNLLGVFGAAALAGGGLAIPEAVIRTDFPVAFLVSLIALPVLASGLSIDRWEGGLMLAAYAGYVAYLFIDSAGGPSADAARTILFVSLVAMAVLMVVVAVVQHRRSPPNF